MSADETTATASGKFPTNGAEMQQFLAYLYRVVPLTTDFNSDSDVEELKRALDEKSSTMEMLRRFLSEPQCAVIFIRVLQQGKGKFTMRSTLLV
jgi:hypothetical protein